MNDKNILIKTIKAKKDELFASKNVSFSDFNKNDYLKLIDLKEFCDSKYLEFIKELTFNFLKKYHVEFNLNDDEIILNKDKTINLVHIVDSLDDEFNKKVNDDLDFINRSEEKNVQLVYVYLKNKESISIVNKINATLKFNKSINIYFYDEFLYEFINLKAKNEFVLNYGNLYEECLTSIGYKLIDLNKEVFIKNIDSVAKKEIIYYNFSEIENIKFLNQNNKFVFLNTKTNSEFKKIFEKNVNKFFLDKEVFQLYLAFSSMKTDDEKLKTISLSLINQMLFKCVQKLNINEKYKSNIVLFSNNLETLKNSYKRLLDTIFINDKYAFTYTDFIYEDKDYTKNYLRKYFYNFLNSNENIKNSTIEMIYLVLCSLF